ncbi:hypothetical protein B0F90DRAFT_1815237 [Multifurca ochricompacta]|uniref:Proteophosphoglycan ppg4 n=1 Tax=Multifurca ochricompacta TaxID=376703 RepID=A0AAD4M9S3_9AGAM|nr:hypothetical protein B0F90DRAFT_1815237 [Multifurca ochricompacta]
MSVLYVLTHRVHLFLAYLSNPSETSFRSYLTEQSFRHHLSRLDDPTDSDNTESNESPESLSPSSSSSSSSSSNQSTTSTFRSLESGSSAFHFSNRAAVALRTPRHTFHSFGFFTIAAVIPSPTHKVHPSSRHSPSLVPSSASARITSVTSDPDLISVKEAWFIGAFGKWWRGGFVDPAWPPHPTSHSKSDEEGWSSGILNIKALDKLDDYDGLPFPTTTHNSRTPQRSAPPRLRSRDRSSSCLHRSSTPPPLPKSAVLPLHTPKHTQPLATPQSPPSHQRSFPSHYPHSPSSTPCGPSQSFDAIPAVAELTRQLSQARALNLELRNQLSEHTNTATAADAALSAELISVREAKRVEDAIRGELKARTKTLEDSRRAAEAGKRDAERRLLAIQKTKAEAGTRIDKLGEEIRALEAQVREDEAAALAVGEAAAQEELDIRSRVKRRKREVRVAEEVVTALNMRVRELEESIEREGVALVAARERAEALWRERERNKHGFILLKKPQDVWEPIPTAESSLATPALETRMCHELLDPFPTPLEKDSDRERERGSSGTVSTRSSPHLHALSAAPAPSVVGYNPTPQAQLQPTGAPEPLARLAKGYAIFDEDLASLSNPSHVSKFLPPVGPDVDTNSPNHPLPRVPNGGLDGIPAPTAIKEIRPPEEILLETFQSDADAFLDRDWRRRLSIPESVSVVGSNMHGHAFPRIGDDSTEALEPFGTRPPPRHRITSDPMDVQRVWLSRTNSEAVSSLIAGVTPHEVQTRRWWKGAGKERRSTTDGIESRKGLNPDAKVFSFSHKPFLGIPTTSAFDSLNPSTSGFSTSGAASVSGTSSGSDSASTATTTTSNSTPGFFSGLAMRAFVPSPAEREALQRALGGSTNTSLERLPSLSEVGSMPTSPVLTSTQAHTTAASNPLGLPWFDIGPGGSARRSWLRDLGVSVPRPGKIKFSPWGDGDEDGIETDK